MFNCMIDRASFGTTIKEACGRIMAPPTGKGMQQTLKIDWKLPIHHQQCQIWLHRQRSDDIHQMEQAQIWSSDFL